MKRQCSCGQHTIGGTQCQSCDAESKQSKPSGALRAERHDHKPRETSQAREASRGATQRLSRKSEAVFGATVEDDEKKVEGNTGTGAAIGGGIGLIGGAIAGGVIGGGAAGAFIGAGIGGLVGGGIGALIGALTGGAISWKSANERSSAAGGSSTTVEQPFNVAYKAAADNSTQNWQLKVASIEGGVDMDLHTGGSRDPISAPPTTEAEASAAVTDMKGYYARGGRGAWHTEAASRAHELHHYREWKCSAEHYWSVAKADIESLTAPVASNANEVAAITTMRAGANGADAKVKAFSDKAHQYWFTLSDSAGARPYAAGQRVLNEAVRSVQDLAGGKGWTVPQGTDDPSPEPPCYQPWI
ncbi:hypothetical protein [Mesorhizobium sp. B1-1-9]|uniref:hypothetical protein n=1 Tax=Mesorhizobium sp. B1-1-9 TaxID=2589975 RepID=UPI0015E490C8|nr:hypothetical protein [Mesorhizobium sp. B1-1-9]